MAGINEGAFIWNAETDVNTLTAQELAVACENGAVANVKLEGAVRAHYGDRLFLKAFINERMRLKGGQKSSAFGGFATQLKRAVPKDSEGTPLVPVLTVSFAKHPITKMITANIVEFVAKEQTDEAAELAALCRLAARFWESDRSDFLASISKMAGALEIPAGTKLCEKRNLLIHSISSAIPAP